jgi:anaerobic selenocysteine-containing dehydrogenase
MPASQLSRRQFLQLGASGAATLVLAGCMPGQPVALEPYVTPPEEQLAGQATWYASTCRQCPAGCGILVRIMNGRAVKIEGNPRHPLNRGKLCARGQAGLQLLYNPDRLSGPVQQAQRGSRQFAPLSWSDGLATLAAKLQAAGPRLAIWAGATLSGHLYDLFQTLAAALGAPPPLVYDLYAELEGYHALQQASADLFGHSALPAYDLSQADLVLSFGADFLATGLSAVRYGVDFGAFRRQPDGRRGTLIQLEPRLSQTAAVADQWLPLRPGTDALVAQALLRLLADQDFGAPERQARARPLAASVDLANLAAACDLSLGDLTRLARRLATAQRPLVIPGPALIGQSAGPAALATVQALNLVLGAAGLSFSAPAPAHAVKPPVAALADAQALIARMQAGQVSTLLIHGANPAYDLPPAAGFLDALKQVPFVVSFAPLVDETAAWADLLLPDRTYLEAWGYDVLAPDFGSPALASQQPVVVPVFDARATADLVLAAAQSLPAAAPALPWPDEVTYLKSLVSQLPGQPANPDLAWARFLQYGGWWPAPAPAAPAPAPQPAQPFPVLSPAFEGSPDEFPFFLLPYVSELLSDGRGANLPWLQGSPTPMTTVAWQTWVEIHPATALKLGLADGDLVKVTSPHGEIEAVVCTYPAIRPDTVALPTGQGHSDLGRYARQRGSHVLALLGAPPAASPTLPWASLRVKLTPTGRKAWLAVFDNPVGIATGFINQALPGQ